MKKPKRKIDDVILCGKCNKPIYIDGLALISKGGIFHKEYWIEEKLI